MIIVMLRFIKVKKIVRSHYALSLLSSHCFIHKIFSKYTFKTGCFPSAKTLRIDMRDTFFNEYANATVY